MKNIYFQLKLYCVISFYFLSLNYLYSQQKQSALSVAKTANEFITTAMQSYQEKDYKKSAEMFEKALNVKPGHPFIMYNLAAVSALTGNKTEALKLLDKLAVMKLTFHPEADSDFISLWSNPLFQEISNKFSANNVKTGHCKTAFQIDEHDLITEGINYYPETKEFYISSIRKRKILSVDENGNTHDFIAVSQDSIWGVFGMAIDKRNGILWASTSAVPQIQNYDNADSGKTGVFKYDLNKKKVIKKYILSDGKEHLFGDLTLNSAGDLFISDSRSNSIYLIDHKKDRLENLLQSDYFVSQQGIALSKDNLNLFLADYAFGIYKINIASKNITKLTAPDSICILGIDGMYFYKNSLIAVQNGTTPNRIIRLFLNSNDDKIVSYKILAANIPPMEDPSLGVIVGDYFYFIANSQWNKTDNNGSAQPYEKWDTPTILKIDLEKTR